MKKLIVIPEESSSPKSNLAAEYFSMQYNYGLYDFDPDKIFEKLEEHYNIKKVGGFPPHYDLEDEEGFSIRVKLEEEYVQYASP